MESWHVAAWLAIEVASWGRIKAYRSRAQKPCCGCGGRTREEKGEVEIVEMIVVDKEGEGKSGVLLNVYTGSLDIEINPNLPGNSPHVMPPRMKFAASGGLA